jgi:hypothetical protein
MSREVDLIVVPDHELAERIMAALKAAGMRHIEFWPEDVLSSSVGTIGHGFLEPVFRLRAHGPQGPFHIEVREEDLVRAQLILGSSRLALHDRPAAAPAAPDGPA